MGVTPNLPNRIAPIIMQQSVLTTADQAEIDRRLQVLEVKDIAITANKVVEGCFRECAKGFRSKELDKKEKECIENCTAKYMDMTNRVYRRYQEIQTAGATNA